MSSWQTRPKAGFFAACLLVVWSLVSTSPYSSARAHPHSFIDLSSKVIFNDAGQITAVRVNWLFDVFYSTFVIADINQANEVMEEALDQLTKESLIALKDYSYFSEILVDGKRVELADPSDGSMSVTGDQLQMAFTVNLANPVDPVSTTFEYAIYDPTYYIEILHISDEVISLEGEGSEVCSASRQKPNPDAETIGFAASLGQNEIGPDNLGQIFAETVTVTCAS